MQKKTIAFSSGETVFYFDATFVMLEKIADKSQSVLLTDENVYRAHAKKFKGWKTIVIKAGEAFKTQATVDSVIGQLIQHGADRKSFLVGIGGGVVTDITGFAASIYMRGIRFGFVPTSILAMVDASVGGKNGVDVGVYKNAVGLIRQPAFLLYDLALLKSLPTDEWVNGFAEIIKHAAIKDARLFAELQKNELEKGDRRLLNFGHTLGHAIENLYSISHGQAIAIGMAAACLLSEQFLDFKDTTAFISVLHAYGLPSQKALSAGKVFEVLKMDKKKEQGVINYVLLKKIGQAVIQSIPVDQLEELIRSITMAR